jgi:hypothetical protein
MLRLCSRLLKSRLLPQTLRQTLAPSAGEVGEEPRLHGRVRSALTVRAGEMLWPGCGVVVCGGCAGFWCTAVAWSVCGGGARPPSSRKNIATTGFFLTPDFLANPAKPSAAQLEKRECARPCSRTSAIWRQTLAPKTGVWLQYVYEISRSPQPGA